MTARAIDFAWTKPSPASIKVDGYAGVLRYLSSDASKAISPAEHAEYVRLGIPVALVYEDGAADFAGGASAGTAKAKIAAPLLAALSWPKDRPVYAAVDENLSEPLYAAAWEGVSAFAAFLVRPVAVYGPRPFLVYCAQRGARFLWELGSSSFNTGPEPQHKTLQQGSTYVTVGGVECDYDEVCAADWGQVPAPVVTPDARAAVVKWAEWGVAHRGAAGGINYGEVRPIPFTNKLPLKTDCSGFATLCYYLAGCPDPNGLRYWGGASAPWVWTGSLVAHGIAVQIPQPGDLVVYGPGDGVHVAIVVQGGTDPLTVSHGQQGDPSYVRVSQGCPTDGYVSGKPYHRFFRYNTSLEFLEHVPSASVPTPAPTPPEDNVTFHDVLVTAKADGQGTTNATQPFAKVASWSVHGGEGPRTIVAECQPAPTGNETAVTIKGAAPGQKVVVRLAVIA